jgi:glutaredoxin
MRPAVSLELLTKNDCSLCDIAKATLDKVLPDYPGVRLSTTDIETDAQLFATYKEKIPVLRINGEDRFIYKVHEITLRKNLDKLMEDTP